MAETKPARIQDTLSDRIIEIAAEIAKTEGAHQVNVRRIITELGVTNRVFYNRFANCGDVLRIVYENEVKQMRSCLQGEYHDRESFVAFCTDAAVGVLNRTYDVKMQFSRYMFEHDALTESNRRWWTEEIKKHYQYALEQGFAKPVDADALCYVIWCFCRGFCVDAVMRRISKEDAIRCFRFGFSCLIGGVLQ